MAAKTDPPVARPTREPPTPIVTVTVDVFARMRMIAPWCQALVAPDVRKTLTEWDAWLADHMARPR